MNNEFVIKDKSRKPYLYIGVLAAVVLALVVLADYPAIGHVAIGLYAALAFWRLDSAQVFRLALVSLGVVLVAVLMGAAQVIDAFSGYSFLLFMVGVFVMARELWRYSQALRAQQEEDTAQ